MKLPLGIIKGQQLVDIFKGSIQYHQDTLLKALSDFDASDLFPKWRTLFQAIEELINLPGELGEEPFLKHFATLPLDFSDARHIYRLHELTLVLKARFDEKVAVRFNQLLRMSASIHQLYTQKGIYWLQGGGLNFSTVGHAWAYFQSRRVYYLTILRLIPHYARGSKKIAYLDLLNAFQQTLDGCLVGISTAYYTLLTNQCLPDYEMRSNGTMASGNFDYDPLEGAFLDPQTLSLLDQLQHRSNMVSTRQTFRKSDKQIFSFVEVAGVMSLFEGVFTQYELGISKPFMELSGLLVDLARFLQNDFDIIIDEETFEAIRRKYTSFVIEDEGKDYFRALNSRSPFQKFQGYYYTTVVLLTRFIYSVLTRAQLKNKTYQIHAGFVFEEKVSQDLAAGGFQLTDIVRISRQEFDVITIKNKKVYNFQCKNNFINISSINPDYIIISRLIKRLCTYYEKALIKERGRERLIVDKTGISEIEHFVISRYPVITRNKNIINYKDLQEWKTTLSAGTVSGKA